MLSMVKCFPLQKSVDCIWRLIYVLHQMECLHRSVNEFYYEFNVSFYIHIQYTIYIFIYWHQKLCNSSVDIHNIKSDSFRINLFCWFIYFFYLILFYLWVHLHYIDKYQQTHNTLIHTLFYTILCSLNVESRFSQFHKYYKTNCTYRIYSHLHSAHNFVNNPLASNTPYSEHNRL